MNSWSHRRRVGLLVLVLALLATVVVPVAAGRTTAGVAVAVPVPDPPVVGQCIGQTFPADWDAVGEHAKAYRYPELVVGDCQHTHYGEVVTVIAHPVAPTVETATDSSFVRDDNMNTCGLAVDGFLKGTGPSTGAEPPTDSYWRPVAFPSVVALRPTNRQRAAGQQWLACGVFLTDRGQTGNGTVVQYRDTLRRAWFTGVGRDYLGYCPDEADWNQATSVGCRVPHHGEIFALGVTSDDTPRATLLSTCATTVRRVTRNAGLPGHGALVVQVQALDQNGASVKGSVIPNGASLQCGVLATGNRLLKGSLIAIGTQPLPWA